MLEFELSCPVMTVMMVLRDTALQCLSVRHCCVRVPDPHMFIMSINEIAVSELDQAASLRRINVRELHWYR